MYGSRQGHSLKNQTGRVPDRVPVPVLLILLETVRLTETRFTCSSPEDTDRTETQFTSSTGGSTHILYCSKSTSTTLKILCCKSKSCSVTSVKVLLKSRTTSWILQVFEHD